MPYKNKADRNYKKENENYGKKTKKQRAERNRARAKLMKEGKVHKGDGKEVDHKKPLSKGGSGKRSNLRVKSAKDNRSYARTSSGAVKSKSKKKS